MNVDRLYKKGLRLEYFTVAYNIFEAIVSIVFGSIANSIALRGGVIGFKDEIASPFSVRARKNTGNRRELKRGVSASEQFYQSIKQWR